MATEGCKQTSLRPFYSCIVLLFMAVFVGYSQEADPQLSASNDYVFEGNSIVDTDFVEAEKKYRLAVSTKQDNATGSFNLGNAYYNSKLYDEALLRHLEAVENSRSKSDKHKAYHNIGNILMQQKQCKEAVSAFKNALRNDPTDDESRYNLALAQDCAKEQGGGEGDDENEDKDKDKDKDENKDEKDNSDEEKDKDDKNKEKGDEDEDKNEGDDKEDEDGKPKDDKGNQKNKDPKEDKGQPQQQPGKLSPQQVKNLLEAMNNEEKKVQEKMNASKTKGVKVKTEKDW